MTVADFERSARAAAAPIAQAGARVGVRILGAVEATIAAVGMNTNLGIVLLCAPLAAAADRATGDLRAALADVLATLDVEDARFAFRAIARAAPAGLGRAERHDVFDPVTATLREAMAAAAGRDRVAYQYVSDFRDIFDVGEPLLRDFAARFPDRYHWATLAIYLEFLGAAPDSHIVRKYGVDIAEETRRSAEAFSERLRACPEPQQLLPDLLAWDAALKSRNINPGTSADLTVATLFVRRLRSILPSSSISD
jgi:triphosphoribosyl-dephospho-CoA synthase